MNTIKSKKYGIPDKWDNPHSHDEREWRDAVRDIKSHKGKKFFYRQEWDIPLYHGKLVVFITNRLKKLKRELPEFGDGPLYAHTVYHNANGWAGYGTVLNFWNQKSRLTHGAITHEVIHLVNMILEDRGFRPDFANDEAVTYLGEWVTNRIYHMIDALGLEVVSDRYQNL